MHAKEFKEIQREKPLGLLKVGNPLEYDPEILAGHSSQKADQ